MKLLQKISIILLIFILFGCQSLDNNSIVAKPSTTNNTFEYEINLNNSYKHLNIMAYSLNEDASWQVIFNRNFQLDDHKAHIDIDSSSNDNIQIHFQSGNFSQSEKINIKNISKEISYQHIYLSTENQDINIVNPFGLLACYYDHDKENKIKLDFNDLSEPKNINLDDGDKYIIITAQLVY